jgi:hypothetical protein
MMTRACIELCPSVMYRPALLSPSADISDLVARRHSVKLAGFPDESQDKYVRMRRGAQVIDFAGAP